jgi:hypothetical protein
LVESTARAAGGLITDPRLLEKVDAEQLIEQITSTIEGLSEARAIRLATLKLPNYAIVEGQRHRGKARLFSILDDPKHGLRRLRVVGTQALVDLVPLLESDQATFDAFITRYFNTPGMESLLKILYPPRSKNDMNLRRTRFRDLFHFYHSQNVYTYPILFAMLGQDYIRTLLTAWFCQGLNKTSFDMITQTTIPQLDKYTGDLTNQLKSQPAQDGWQIFAELKNLTGYRFLPWEGFDAKADTLEFATGGQPHDMYHSFQHWLHKAIGPLKSLSPTFKPLTFLEFITSNHWITAGASTEGHIVIEYDGKLHKIKCRKNVVKDVILATELYQQAIDSTEQIAHAFAKYETGKIRIAVTGDLLTYLKMSWIAYLSEYSYKKWPHTTRLEDGLSRTTRMLQIINLCKAGYYGLALDFKGFERQVQSAECQVIQAAVDQQAVANYSACADIAANIQSTFDNSILIGMDGAKYNVTGGLPSGILGTSYIGDGFNISAAEAAINNLKSLGVPEVAYYWLQGDDGNYMDNNPHLLQLMDWLFARMGFEAGIGKFGITPGSTEFLRVSYDANGAHGYPARSIVGLVQRKPWSDAPTSDVLPISSALDALITSSNRGLRLTKAIKVISQLWSRLHKISPKIASSPQPNGLGIGSLIPNIRYNGKIEKPLIIQAQVKTPYRRNYWTELSESVDLPLNSAQIDALVARDMQSMLITDSVPGATGILRESVLAHLATTTTFIELPPLTPILNTITLAKDIQLIGTAVRPETNPLFGAYSLSEAALQKYSPLKQFGLSLTKLRAIRYPAYAAAIRSLRKLNFSHDDAILYLTADLPTNTGRFNKSITTYLQAAIANQIQIGVVPKSRLVDLWLTLNNLVLIDFERAGPLIELHTW